jgi:hypothetical protein
LLWRGAKADAVFQLTAEPRFETPLFGFFVSGNAANAGSGGRARQPDALAAQLDALGVRHAVLLPVEVDGRLPFKLSVQNQFDVAVHEAFHAHVQMPVWAGIERSDGWPAWTSVQPDRSQLALRCYGSADARAPLLAAEREPLVRAATAALGREPIEGVCRDARSFLSERRRRWSDLTSVRVDGESPGPAMSCVQAEVTMELDEGVPDFVAWMTARQLRIVDDERVGLRFKASQRDVFYLTGMMQLVVLRHLLGTEFAGLTARIAASPSWESGALADALDTQLAARCQ